MISRDVIIVRKRGGMGKKKCVREGLGLTRVFLGIRVEVKDRTLKEVVVRRYSYDV